MLRDDNSETKVNKAAIKQDEHDNTYGHSHDDEHEHGEDDDHDEEESSSWKSHWQLLLSLVILFAMLILQFGFKYVAPFPFNLIIFSIAYLLAGYSVLGMAFRKAKRFDFFNEFFLMSVATIGAFAYRFLQRRRSSYGFLFDRRMVSGFSS